MLFFLQIFGQPHDLALLVRGQVSHLDQRVTQLLVLGRQLLHFKVGSIRRRPEFTKYYKLKQKHWREHSNKKWYFREVRNSVTKCQIGEGCLTSAIKVSRYIWMVKHEIFEFFLSQHWNFRIPKLKFLKKFYIEIVMFAVIYSIMAFTPPPPPPPSPQKEELSFGLFLMCLLLIIILYSLYYFITLYFYGYLKAIQLDAVLNKSYFCCKSVSVVN